MGALEGILTGVKMNTHLLHTSPCGASLERCCGRVMTLDCDNAAAACTAGIIVHLTGVDPRILKHC